MGFLGDPPDQQFRSEGLGQLNVVSRGIQGVSKTFGSATSFKKLSGVFKGVSEWCFMRY